MPREYEGRPDVYMAESVEEVLRSVEPYRRLHAAQLLRVLGVPFRVIVRVLAEPNKRRHLGTGAQNASTQARNVDLPGNRESNNGRRA
jgi:hypothetical protein